MRRDQDAARSDKVTTQTQVVRDIHTFLPLTLSREEEYIVRLLWYLTALSTLTHQL